VTKVVFLAQKCRKFDDTKAIKKKIAFIIQPLMWLKQAGMHIIKVENLRVWYGD
jgi:hypothetical protein